MKIATQPRIRFTALSTRQLATARIMARGKFEIVKGNLEVVSKQYKNNSYLHNFLTASHRGFYPKIFHSSFEGHSAQWS